MQIGEQALRDVTNPKAGGRDESKQPPITKVWSRRRRQADDQPHPAQLDSATASQAENTIPEKPALADGSSAHKASPKAKQSKTRKPYSRKAMPSLTEQEEAERAKWYAAMRAHFAKIDAFELVVESPPVSDKKRSCSTPKQATSLGIKPRKLSSSTAATPEGISKGCHHLGGDHDSPPSASAGQHQQQSTPSTSQLANSPDSYKSARDYTTNSPVADDNSPHPPQQPALPSTASSDGTPQEASPRRAEAAQQLLAPRPMALGMSRRRSVCIAHQTGDSSRQSITGTPGGQQAGADARRGSSSMAEGRPSLLQRLSSRTSLGNALARLSIGMSSRQSQPVRGSVGRPAGLVSHRMSDVSTHEAAGRRATAGPGLAGMSPVAESPAGSHPSPHTQTPTPPPSVTPEVSGSVQQPPASGFTRLQSPPVQVAAGGQSDVSVLAGDLQQRLAIVDDADVGGQLHAADEQASPQAAREPLSPLEALLHLCNQQAEAQALPSMDEVLLRYESAQSMRSVRKLGEGTFGEAYGTATRVFKVLPLEGQKPVNGEAQRSAVDMLAEAAISLALSQLREPGGDPPAANTTSGFVELCSMALCRGAYSRALTREWRAWDRAHGSENDPVDGFEPGQLFMVYVNANGGADLEHLEVKSYEEAVSILMQVTLTLAVAEEACDFEHRDLHWGNLLIRRTTDQAHTHRFRGVDMRVRTQGVRVTLIDFTLSRLRSPAGDVQFCNLADDPALFKGPKNDCQADTYRRMRAKTRGHWEEFHPETNALWLHYLADVLLSHKKLPCSRVQLHALRGFRKRALACTSCSELVWDGLFQDQWLALPVKQQPVE